MPLNRQIILDNRPQGKAAVTNFKLVQSDTPTLVDGQVLVQHHYLSLDPYMRGRMDDAKSYTQPQALGQVMLGGTVGTVVQSRNPRFATGDSVLGMGGWQEYSVVDATVVGSLKKIDTQKVPMSAYLGAVGMPGVTAYYGLVHIIAAQAGQTMVVSAAAGAVGSAFGALSKARGCRTVGIAGGADKCRYVVDELGFDGCIDYKSFPDAQALSAAIQAHCPKGIDGYFENVGGMMMDGVLPLMNAFGRIAVCGMIAGYNGSPIPMAQPFLILRSRLTMEGFIVSEHPEIWPTALTELAQLVIDNKLRPRESIALGIEATPDAFLGLLNGHNFGKQLVKLV